jgi:transcriptional regulator with XRE-family HTH domain
MVTRIGSGRRAHLYIEEWIKFRGLSDETVGNRLGRARETIWRWRTEQHRLNPEKLAELASALDIEPQDFYRPPSRPSIDALVEDAPDDLRNTALDIVRRLVGRKS